MDYSYDGATLERDPDIADTVATFAPAGNFGDAFAAALEDMADDAEPAPAAPEVPASDPEPEPEAPEVPAEPNRFAIEADPFRAALKLFARVAEKRPTIPALACGTFQGEGDTVLIRATDCDAIVTARLPAVNATGRGTFPVHDAIAFMGKSKDSVLMEFDAAEPCRVAIASGGSRAAFNVVPFDDVPKTFSGIGDYTARLTIGGEVLHRMLSDTSIAVSTEETRYYLNGVFFHVPPDHSPGDVKLRAVATDGHRLVMREIDAPADFAATVSAARRRLKEAEAVKERADSVADKTRKDAALSESLNLAMRNAAEAESECASRALEEDSPDAWADHASAEITLRTAAARLKAAVDASPIIADPAAAFDAAEAAEEARFAAAEGAKEAADGAARWPGIIIPRVALDVMLRMLAPVRKRFPESVLLEWSARGVALTVGAVTVESKVIDGTFPDYMRVIPGESGIVARFDRAALIDTAESVAKIKARLNVDLSEGGDNAFLHGSFEGATVERAIPCETWDRPSFGFAVNARYLADLAKLCDGPEFCIVIGRAYAGDDRPDAGAPLLIREGGLTLVLMPMRRG